MVNKGSLIAELRKEAGFTQKSLAEALHITDKAVSKWERGLSLPDIMLLPKLSLLLGVDMSLLLAPGNDHLPESWMGLIDLRAHPVDLSQKVYDKPLVYFLLSHFLLANVREICILCSEENRECLESERFFKLGFTFTFDFSSCKNRNLMILNRPCFLFGSDLTHHFQGGMMTESVVKLVPENIAAPFLFCLAKYAPVYIKNPDYLYEQAIPRTLGRGMVCVDMDDVDKVMEVSTFVQMQQRSSNLLIGSLEEIAYKKGMIDETVFLELIKSAPYKKQLEILVKRER